MDAFPKEEDSTIFVRNRTRGTKLDGTFDRKRGRIVGESSHTVTMQHPNESQPKVYAKRDVAKPPNKPKRPKSTNAPKTQAQVQIKERATSARREKEQLQTDKPIQKLKRQIRTRRPTNNTKQKKTITQADRDVHKRFK